MQIAEWKKEVAPEDQRSIRLCQVICDDVHPLNTLSQGAFDHSYVEDVITTNWDDFFETECGATPIVTAEDFGAFSDVPGRKVLKIHGSINNYGSVIVTDLDYAQCYRNLRTGIVGSVLKVLLASKTVIFVGYSFEDEDFKRLYHVVNKELGKVAPHSFVVTLDETADEKLKEMKANATAIITDGTFFLQSIKAELVKRKLMLGEDRFSGLDEFRMLLLRISANLWKSNLVEYPEVYFTSAFLDGAAFGLDYLKTNLKRGRLLKPGVIQAMVKAVEHHGWHAKNDESLEDSRYEISSYFRGIVTGLKYPLLTKRDKMRILKYYDLWNSPQAGDSVNYFGVLIARRRANPELLTKAAMKLKVRPAGTTHMMNAPSLSLFEDLSELERLS